MKNIITILLIIILPLMAYLIIEKRSALTTATAMENSLPTVMVFSSSMCLDCQKLKGVINEIKNDYEGKVNFISYNALDKDKNVQKHIKTYQIILAPTTIILDKNGNKINKIEGYIPKEELKTEIEEAING